MQSFILNQCKVLMQGFKPGTKLTYTRNQQLGKQAMDQLMGSLMDLNLLMEISGEAHDTAGGHATCPRAWVSPCASRRTAGKSEHLGLQSMEDARGAGTMKKISSTVAGRQHGWGCSQEAVWSCPKRPHGWSHRDLGCKAKSLAVTK